MRKPMARVEPSGPAGGGAAVSFNPGAGDTRLKGGGALFRNDPARKSLLAGSNAKSSWALKFGLRSKPEPVGPIFRRPLLIDALEKGLEKRAE